MIGPGETDYRLWSRAASEAGRGSLSTFGLWLEKA
jgi:hypothetical protein